MYVPSVFAISQPNHIWNGLDRLRLPVASFWGKKTGLNWTWKHYAHPSIFSWPMNLIAKHVHQEINQLSRTNVPGGENHLRASMNGRHLDQFKLVTWQALGKLSISALCEKYKAHAPVDWYIMKSMAASHKGGVFIVKKQRPHPIIRFFINFGGLMYWLSLRSKSALLACLFSQETILLMGILRWPWVYGILQPNHTSMSNI